MSEFDLVVVGGGIQGVGVAQAAAADGYRVALLEAGEIGGATSSKSSKLIHGGLRYLESAQFSLVRQSLKERQQLLQLAPALVQLRSFYIPVYKSTGRRPWQIRLGLLLYSFLDGFSKETRFNKLHRRDWGRLDGMDKNDLQCVYRYYDAQTDDQKLTRAVMESAQSLGVELLCPARFLKAQEHDGILRIRYEQATQLHTITASVLVNAAGPWVNEILQSIIPRPEPLAVDLVQGSHIVIDHPAPEGMFYVEAQKDRRAVFIMPWYGLTLIGTTETLYSGNPANVEPLPEEIAYLREVYESYFPNNEFNLVSSFAGIRVLPVSESSLFNRARDVVIYSDQSVPGVVTLYGGKLTSFRATAEKVMRLIRPHMTAPDKKRADVNKLMLGQD